MKFIALPALATAMLLSLANGADAQQQQGGQMPDMQGIDHSRMQNMPGMDHGNMPGMQGNAPAGRTAPAMKPSRPGVQTQQRTD